MTDIRKLWILGALAILGAACDPYEEENKSPLQILGAFAVAGNSADNATGLFEASGAASPFTISDVDPGTTVFFVKTNKLLDGAAIQADPMSCAPAAAVNLTVNGVVNPPGWYTCYVPATSTPAEGASVVIYQGSNIDNTTGYFDAADLSPGFYVINATITDKQGNAQPITINSAVSVAVVDEDAATTTTIDVSWDVGTAVGAGATSIDLQRAPNVVNADGDDEPGEWATIAADLPVTTASFTDTGLTADTSYWYRLVLKSATGNATSAPVEIATAAP